MRSEACRYSKDSPKDHIRAGDLKIHGGSWDPKADDQYLQIAVWVI